MSKESQEIATKEKEEKSLQDKLSSVPFKETSVGTTKLDRALLEEDCSPNSPKCTVFKAEYFLLRMMKRRSIRLDWYTQDNQESICGQE